MWLRDPLHSDSYVYNFPLLLRVRGPLNESALRGGLQEIVQRHEVLRSVFRILDGELVQIIVPAPELSLPVTDLSGLPESARDARVQELALEEANRPFDLAQGRLFRGQLIRLATDDHVLQLTTHHLVYDDWSTGILIRELSPSYPSVRKWNDDRRTEPGVSVWRFRAMAGGTVSRRRLGIGVGLLETATPQPDGLPASADRPCAPGLVHSPRREGNSHAVSRIGEFIEGHEPAGAGQPVHGVTRRIPVPARATQPWREPIAQKKDGEQEHDAGFNN